MFQHADGDVRQRVRPEPAAYCADVAEDDPERRGRARSEHWSGKDSNQEPIVEQIVDVRVLPVEKDIEVGNEHEIEDTFHTDGSVAMDSAEHMVGMRAFGCEPKI